jgi:hypothetical protein
MRKPRFQHRQMYAVSCEGIGIIAGTMAYSRGAAIDFFLPPGCRNPEDWPSFKNSGYRTVKTQVRVIDTLLKPFPTPEAEQ